MVEELFEALETGTRRGRRRRLATGSYGTITFAGSGCSSGGAWL